MSSKLKYILVLAASVLPQYAWAQGPAQNGSLIPVALLFVGAAVLGAVMVYGIMQNRKRSRAEKQLTEQATRENYKRQAGR